MNYWYLTYGQKSNEFIEGVIAGVRTFAVWKNGKEVVGVLETPLKEVIKDIKTGMGYKENDKSGVKE